jgi:hypothetical protein
MMNKFSGGIMVQISVNRKNHVLRCQDCLGLLSTQKGRFFAPANLLFITNQSNSIMADHVILLSNDELHMVCKIDWMSNRIRTADFEVEAELGRRPDPTRAAPTSTCPAPARSATLSGQAALRHGDDSAGPSPLHWRQAATPLFQLGLA